MRRPLIVANWKMNMIRDEALNFIYDVHQAIPSKEIMDTVVCAPAILLRSLVKRQGDNLRIGAQDMHYMDSGPYTGDLSPLSLVATGVEYIIIGHSERRSHYKETNETVNLKVLSALKHKLIPIICVGETLEQNENGEAQKTVEKMVRVALMNVSSDNMENVVIAYEPVWAIGTGKSADSAMAEGMAKIIRDIISVLYNKSIADKVRILYGGSVSPSNLELYINKSNIDGALIGSASLVASNFIQMINVAKKTI